MLSQSPRALVTRAELLLVTAAGAGMLAAAPATASAAPRAATFVHSARSGQVQGGRLTLNGVARNVTWVSNDGHSGVISVAALHSRLFSRLAPPGWPQSLKDSPAPTAVLHVAGRRRGGVTALTLSAPRYNAARHTVSYRVRRLNGGPASSGLAGASQAPLARRFGPASLSITALGSPADVWRCGTIVINNTGYPIEATASGLWPTDTWDNGIPPNSVLSPGDNLGYGSYGGFMRGCGNSSTWTIIDGPPGVRGATFDFYTTFPYGGGGQSGTCTPSVPNFVCVNQNDYIGGTMIWSLQPAKAAPVESNIPDPPR